MQYCLQCFCLQTLNEYVLLGSIAVGEPDITVVAKQRCVFMCWLLGSIVVGEPDVTVVA